MAGIRMGGINTNADPGVINAINQESRIKASANQTSPLEGVGSDIKAWANDQMKEDRRIRLEQRAEASGVRKEGRLEESTIRKEGRANEAATNLAKTKGESNSAKARQDRFYDAEDDVYMSDVKKWKREASDIESELEGLDPKDPTYITGKRDINKLRAKQERALLERKYFMETGKRYERPISEGGTKKYTTKTSKTKTKPVVKKTSKPKKEVKPRQKGRTKPTSNRGGVLGGELFKQEEGVYGSPRMRPRER